MRPNFKKFHKRYTHTNNYIIVVDSIQHVGQKVSRQDSSRNSSNTENTDNLDLL